MTFLVFAADEKADVFPSFERIATLKDEAFVLCLDKSEVSGMQERTVPMPRPTPEECSAEPHVGYSQAILGPSQVL